MAILNTGNVEVVADYKTLAYCESGLEAMTEWYPGPQYECRSK